MIAFMSLRTFFIIRTIINYSPYMDAYSKKLCNAYGFDTGVFFTIKCLLLVKPEKTCIYMNIYTIFVSAYLSRIFELPAFRASGDPVFDSYYNSIYFICISMTTIGYGDICPLTIPGQLVTMFLAFWGTLLVSLLVVICSNVFNLNSSE